MPQIPALLRPKQSRASALSDDSLIDMMLGGSIDGRASVSPDDGFGMGAIGKDYGVSLGALGQLGLAIAQSNPIGFALGIANAVNNVTNNKSTAHSVFDAISEAISTAGDALGFVTSATPAGNIAPDNTNAMGPMGTIDESRDFDGNIDGMLDMEGQQSTGNDTDATDGNDGVDSSDGNDGVDGNDGNDGVDGRDGNDGSDGSDGGSGGDGGDGGGYAKGGKIPGHDLTGSDSKTIKATPGEFVLPTHIVDLIGEQNLNAFISLFPAPKGN